jgi:organic hydroperoxide reductase OsmC/OhrA
MSVSAAVDPEEAFVASIASCHMLWFLSIAASKKLVVDRYEDHPEGTLTSNDEGKLAMGRVTLKPRVSFGGADVPSTARIDELHRLAHEHCFIARSVRTEIVIVQSQGQDEDS